MCPTYQVNFIFSVELLHDVTAEQVSSTSRANTPPRRILRVTPHEVAHSAVMWHLLLPVDRAYLIQRIDARAQTAMDAEDFVINDGCKSQVVEDVCAVPPDIDGAVLSQALVVETIHLSDLSALVVASNQSDSLRVPHLEGQEEQECLHRVEASVDEVAHEQVVGVGALSAHFEELLEVVELAVYVTTDLTVGKNELKQWALTVTGLCTC